MATTAELPFVIKICGITNAEDAAVAVEAGANALGFNFYRKSPRSITAERAREIVQRVKGKYLRVGIFVNASEREIQETIEEVPLDCAQLHGAQCGIPKSTSCAIWRAVFANHLPEQRDPRFAAYLVDTPSAEFGGSGRTFDWKVAAARGYRVLLAGGLDASNVDEAIRTAQPWGVDACSRLEAGRGKKDAQKIREFVRAAQAASFELTKAVS